MKYLIKRMVHNSGNLLRWLLVNYLRMTGIRIGHGTMISLRAKLDTRRGRIVIGNHCIITYGCVILSHDAAACRINPGDAGEGEVIIEDNVFIGVNTIILRNVTIGRNSIIGAGSVVSRSIPPNCVAMGNPACVVKELQPR